MLINWNRGNVVGNEMMLLFRLKLLNELLLTGPKVSLVCRNGLERKQVRHFDMQACLNPRAPSITLVALGML